MRFDANVLEQIREQNPVSEVLMRLGVKLRRAGREWVGLSPFNAEKSPSFTVNDEKGFFHDFSSGQHGDVIDAVVMLTGRSFPEAVEWLGGVREVSPEEASRIEQRRRERTEEERKEAATVQARCQRVFEGGAPIQGTAVEAYLEERGLDPDPSWTFDLRFVEMPYKGYRDEGADEEEKLGTFPCMVAAIRDKAMQIIGLHRTFLDPSAPIKLKTGDAKRNRAKKIIGEMGGGLIWLSQPSLRIAMGEGIETSRSWQLMHGDSETALVAGISLGNMAGAATGTIENPAIKGKRVPNGTPDMDRPGARLPDDTLEVILLGDGDSNRENTRAHILVAGRRFRSEGRQVSVHFAPDGRDFNDEWTESGS